VLESHTQAVHNRAEVVHDGFHHGKQVHLAEELVPEEPHLLGSVVQEPNRDVLTDGTIRQSKFVTSANAREKAGTKI